MIDRRVLLAAGAAGLIAPAEALAAPAPRRVVSLNACLDAMVVHLADRSQITALSHYARDPHGSTIAAVARTLPFTWETAEEVVGLRPDLVVASLHTSPAARNALKQLNVPVQRFGVPKTVKDSLAQVRRMADLLGQAERGEDLIRRIEQAIVQAAPPPGAKPLTALIYQPNGFAAGPGTLADEMMRRAGFENAARRYGLKSWRNVPLETLMADPPQVLLSGEPAPGARSWADRVMTHPALKRLDGRMQQVRIPERLLYCGGPVLIQSAAAFAAARRQVTGA